MRLTRTLLPFVLLAALACGDSKSPTKPQGPGTLRATIVSPNGLEGAAVIQLSGSGFGQVGGVVPNTFVSEAGSPVQVTIVNPAAGALQFTVAVDEVTKPPTVTFVEIAGPTNLIRESLSGYKVKWEPMLTAAATR